MFATNQIKAEDYRVKAQMNNSPSRREVQLEIKSSENSANVSDEVLMEPGRKIPLQNNFELEKTKNSKK